MKQIIITFAIIFSCCCCNNIKEKKEYDYETFRMNFALFVLNENQIGKKYFVRYDTLNYNLEDEFTWLGEIKNSKENNLNFLFCTTFSGIYADCKRANSNVLIFKKNKLWGYYYVGGGFEKVPIINGSDLIFFPSEWQECNLTTTINFRDSVPQQIFIKCSNENIVSGDLFTLYKVTN
ncbi:MAG: hypothetical protein LBH32_10440 [Dysgonamonadaceae bacterium]|jgi:hypothetical protein|nr:hypothetical protein [Dysgonamonadaceae bacterium]